MNNASDIFKPGSLFFSFLPQEPTVHTQVYRHIGFAPTDMAGFLKDAQGRNSAFLQFNFFGSLKFN